MLEEREDDVDVEASGLPEHVRFILKLTSDFELGPEVAEAMLNLNPMTLRDLLDTEETLRLRPQTLLDVQACIAGIRWLIEATRDVEQQSATPFEGDADVQRVALGART